MRTNIEIDAELIAADLVLVEVLQGTDSEHDFALVRDLLTSLDG